MTCSSPSPTDACLSVSQAEPCTSPYLAPWLPPPFQALPPGLQCSLFSSQTLHPFPQMHLTALPGVTVLEGTPCSLLSPPFAAPLLQKYFPDVLSFPCWSLVFPNRNFTYTHTHTQSTLVICRFHICEFVHSLKCICYPHINTCSPFVVTTNTHRAAKSLSCLRLTFSAGVEQGKAEPSCFCLLHCRRVSFLWSV